MKLHYYPETDSLYIELKPEPGKETREVVSGLNVDLDANGDVVGFDIEHASRKRASSIAPRWKRSRFRSTRPRLLEGGPLARSPAAPKAHARS